MAQYDYTGGGVTGSLGTVTFKLIRAACCVFIPTSSWSGDRSGYP